MEAHNAAMINELVSFLDSTLRDARAQAVAYIAGLTAHEEGKAQLLNTNVLEKLTNQELLSDYSQFIAKNTLTSLINLCDTRQAVEEVLRNKKLVPLLVKHLEDEHDDDRELKAMLLCNLSLHRRGCEEILGLGTPLKGLNLYRLVDTFVFQENQQGSTDPHSWIATLLMNITLVVDGGTSSHTSQIPEGRAILLDPQKNILPLLLPFIRDKQPRRRHGVLGAIKNCALAQENHKYLLLPEVGLVPQLLYPLRGPERLEQDDMQGLHPLLHNSVIPTDKQREADAETRKLILEIFILLCSSQESREVLRSNKVYPIIREAEKQEKDPEVNALMHDLVSRLMFAPELDIMKNIPQEPPNDTVQDTARAALSKPESVSSVSEDIEEI